MAHCQFWSNVFTHAISHSLAVHGLVSGVSQDVLCHIWIGSPPACSDSCIVQSVVPAIAEHVMHGHSAICMCTWLSFTSASMNERACMGSVCTDACR